ncbi:MAG: urate hydroxylase PuuD [Thiohalobacteraceae bacterium]|nr:urate hydroxylase PuuD [Gammaproteobacteria bacterium]
MNPLKSIPGTIISGFVLAVILVFVLGPGGAFNPWEFWVWMHVLAGITWIGLLYYFNFVQVPAVGQALAEAGSGGPGAAAINKYVAPRALLWFRWGALATWITGAMALEYMAKSMAGAGSGIVAAFTFADNFELIGMGAWLGTIMLFNVWVLIWPNQKKILGIVQASAEEIGKAKVVALMASRTNTLLSIPMLLGMTGHMHGMPF